MHTTTPTVRPLDSAERTLLDRAMTVALTVAPYFGSALWRMRPVAAEGLGTFAVDRHWRLYLDPTQMRTWGPQHSGGVLIHEVGHLLRQHANRAEGLPQPVDHTRWNLATDACINSDLITGGIPLPEGAVTPEALGLEPNGIEEDYYHALDATGEDDEPGGCGSGAGDPDQAWELPASDTNAPAVPASVQNLARRQVAQAILDAPGHTRQTGSTPAGLRRWAEQALTPPTIDWRTALRAAVRSAITYTANGQADYTYTRPGRRHLPGIITPATHTPRITAATVIDTSGSMTAADLSAAVSEVRGIVAATRSRLTIVAVDTETTITRSVTDGARVNLTGGGGTDMRVGIAEAQRTRPRPDVIIVLTDGFTPWPDAPTPQRLVVGLVGQHTGDTPDWATTVRITPGG